MPRVSVLLLSAALALAAATAAARPGGDLVSYSYDDGRTETGPESFVVFEHAKGRVDLSGLAQSFGGGGHKNAAGGTISGTLEEIKKKVINAVEEGIRKQLGAGGSDHDGRRR